ncbi:hypothetical protein TNCV_4103051 [Trichonephila clavipes]|nr:hypothetical protein TNCV_4103051 [Trichonephila clavipes]
MKSVENFVARRSSFPSHTICQYIELPNMGNKESPCNSTSTTSSCKGHCKVRVYSIMYDRAIPFLRDGCFLSCYRYRYRSAPLVSVTQSRRFRS